MHSIVLSTEVQNYRRLAQLHYGLTDEQMKGVHVHHNPPRASGGRNIPEHLYIYSVENHSYVHGDDQFTSCASEGGKKGGTKTQSIKDEEGRSIRALEHNKRLHSVKNEEGKSVHALKHNERLHSVKNEEGKSVHALNFHEKCKKLGKGLPGIPSDVLSDRVSNTNKQKWRCPWCDFISNARETNKHMLDKHGLDSRHKIKVS